MTEIFRGKFPWVNTRGHVKRVTGSAHEMVRVVSWNGVSMPMVQEPGLTSFAFYPKNAKFLSYVRSGDESPTGSESCSSDGKQTEMYDIFTLQIAHVRKQPG